MIKLLEQDFKDCPHVIMDLAEFNKDALAVSNKLDLAVLLLENNISFNKLSRKFRFTKDQLDELSNKFPKLWSIEKFLCLYMEKLFPTQISFYLSRYTNNGCYEDDDDDLTEFMRFLPTNLAMDCYDILLQFVMHNERAGLPPKQIANILLNYLLFRLKYYVC